MKFRLEIELGDGHDQPLTLIVSSLRDIACTVQSQGILFAQTRAIANHNGKNVGEWEITEDTPIEGQCVSDEELAAERAALSPADRAIVDALPSPATFKDGICRVCGVPVGKGFTCCGSICLHQEAKNDAAKQTGK